MKLRNLRIAGFKSIKSQDIALGTVNVFIGQNGAGKSNILEALGMLSAAINGTISYSQLSISGVRLSSPAVYRSALHGSPRPMYFGLEAEFESLRYSCRVFTDSVEPNRSGQWRFHSESFHRTRADGKPKKLAGRSAHGISIGGKPFETGRLSTSESIISAVEILGNLSETEAQAIQSLKDFGIFAPSTGILRGVNTDPSVKSPLGLGGGGLAIALSEVLQSKNRNELTRFFKVLSWFKSLAVVAPTSELKAKHVGGGDSVVAFRDRFMSTDFNTLYAFDVSEGALYVCFMLVLLLHSSSPKLFALDNVDSTLNPGLVINVIRNIADLAATLDKQVILTTHNPTALDALNLFDEEHFLYVVDRNKTGETEAIRLKPPEGMTEKQWTKKYGDAPLSELWIDGLLGGITAPDHI